MLKNLPITAQNLHFWLSATLAFMLPVYQKAVAAIILLIGINWLIATFKYKLLKISNLKFLPILFICLYLLHVLSGLYSANKSFWLFELEIKLSFILLPLFYFTTLNLTYKQIEKIKSLFIYGCLVIVCYKFFRLVFPSLKLDNGPIGFSGPYFTYPMHLGYFSWYLLTAIFFLIHKWIKDISNPKRYIFTVVLFLVFSVTIFLATSKTALIVYAFLFIWFLKIQLKLLQKWYIKLAVIIIPIAILLTVIAQNSTSYPVRRLINIALIFKQTEMNPQAASSIEMRYFAWKNAIEVFANNFVIGVGAGDQKDVVAAYYQKNNYTAALNNNLNAHNQFLQTALTLGIVGLTMLFIIFFYPIIQFIKNKKMIHLAGFTTISVIFALTEAILEVQAGIVFFVCFYLWLLKQHYTTKYDTVFAPSN